MWVERIEINGFGRLRGLTVDLRDGLNVVTGLNETGKSTLHQAIATGVFGFFASTDRRREQEAEKRRERYAPWDGGPYGLGVILRRPDSAALRIDWDLNGRTSFRASDALTGADCTAQLRGAGEGVLRHDLHGISRAVFDRSLVVRQGELAAIADDEGAVARALEAALASSERQASASRAVEILAAQRDAIGTARSSKRPLPMARAEVHHAEQELRAAEAGRAEIEGAALAARADEREASGAERLLHESRAGTRSRRLAELDEVQIGVSRLESRLAELDRQRSALADAAPVDPAAIRELELAHEARTIASERAERARRAADGAEPALADAEARLREADGAIAANEAYRAGPDSAAVGELERVLALVEERIATTPRPSRRPLATLGAAGLLLLIAVVLLAGGSLLGAVALLVVALGCGGLGVHWLMLERERARQRDLVGATEDARRRALLEAAGLDADALGAEDRFRHAAGCRDALEDASARAVALRGQVQELGRERAESRRLDGELVEAERRVRSAYVQLGVDPSDEAEAASAIESRRDRATLRVTLDGEHRHVTAELTGLVSGRDVQALANEAMELRAAGVVPSTGDRPLVDPGEIADRATAARARAAASRSAFETLASGLADTSVLREQLATAEEKAARLEHAHEVLSIAADALAEAAAEAYRDVAPHLNAALSQALDRATDGRYREARVAPDLTVVVHGPERAAPVPLDELSFGTRELVHLVQRLELARLLGGDDPPPLLLDDVLGHTDTRRRHALAALIADTATRQQVIVLATTPEAAEALLGATDEVNHVDLTDFVPAAPSLF